MGVTYELIDAPYPSLCAVYRCRCGATATRYGNEASSPPPGWLVEPADGREDALVRCPECRGRGPSNHPNGEREPDSG
jgi:hypothetical protein